MRRPVWLLLLLVSTVACGNETGGQVQASGSPSWVPVEIRQRLEAPTAEDNSLRLRANAEKKFDVLVSLGQFGPDSVVAMLSGDEFCFGLLDQANLFTMACVRSGGLPTKPLWVQNDDKAFGVRGAVMGIRDGVVDPEKSSPGLIVTDVAGVAYLGPDIDPNGRHVEIRNSDGSLVEVILTK